MKIMLVSAAAAAAIFLLPPAIQFPIQFEATSHVELGQMLALVQRLPRQTLAAPSVCQLHTLELCMPGWRLQSTRWHLPQKNRIDVSLPFPHHGRMVSDEKAKLVHPCLHMRSEFFAAALLIATWRLLPQQVTTHCFSDVCVLIASERRREEKLMVFFRGVASVVCALCVLDS